MEDTTDILCQYREIDYNKDKVKECMWWSALAQQYGYKLYGWNGMPPSCSAQFIGETGDVVEISGKFAMALFNKVMK